MFTLKNATNEEYLNSVMFKYKRGDLSRTEAEKQLNDLFRESERDLADTRNETNQQLDNLGQETKRELNQLGSLTIDQLQERRAKSLREILDYRKDHFGGTLDISPLEISFDDVKVRINGVLQAYEQPPVIIDGYTLVPMRAIFEQLGAEIEWDNSSKTVTAKRDGVTMSLQIGHPAATLNGNQLTLDMAPTLVQGNTMVPLRFVGEGLNAEVKWEAASKTVLIETTE